MHKGTKIQKGDGRKLVPRPYDNRNDNKQPSKKINNVIIEEINSGEEGSVGSSNASEDTYYKDLMSKYEGYETYSSYSHMARTVSISPGTTQEGIVVNLGSVNVRAFTTKFRQPTMIFDTGADTCVIGKGWEILEETGHFANLVGFDHNYSSKNNLPIVNAYTTIEYDNHIIPLVAYHVVYNVSSHMSLMSVCQLAKGGCIIDPMYCLLYTSDAADE